MQLPEGMGAIYDRMASSIVDKTSPTDKVLAVNILQCVTVSLRVLSVAELRQSLHGDSSTMLDFQRSVVDLCGGFVVMDNGGNVTLIHQTAREYLLNRTDRSFHVDEGVAHTQMFLNCMRCLMAVGLRAKVKDSRKPEFLDYAAASFSTHLSSLPLDSDHAIKVLCKFLTGSWVLTWIHLLATSQQLDLLIQASKHLSQCSARRRAYEVADDNQNLLKQELVDRWAKDLLKIVGKFGLVLRRNPESIYKLIPPFCPKTSAIYQQFGQMKDKSLVVSGLSSEDWDDTLARMSFGSATYAASILTAGPHIAILVPTGSVILYDSSTFGEATASPVNHGERVYRMELSSNGALLVTYGYCTTKIWETATGKCRLAIASIESRPRPLSMLLTNNNSTLHVGTDDRRLRTLDLSQTSPNWQLVAEFEEPELEGHILNSANYMALNSDAKLIVVAYRGHPLSAWETDGPVHIGHCWRKREEIARGEVIEAVWLPHQPEVLGLYIEGTVFKWSPYDDEAEEIATGASRLAISRDGNLFATGDVRGTIKVYTTSDFGLLYRLTSEDTVLGLTFSPNLRRFYDIRGYYGNVWEPNALVKFAEQRSQGEERASETESPGQSYIASENLVGRIDSVTILAGSPVGCLYCWGTEKGAIHLHDIQRGKLAVIHYSKGFFSIEHMTWSNDGRYLCFSDSSKKIMIMSFTLEPGAPAPIVETKAELSMKNGMNGPLLQILFHPDSTQLLLRSASTVCTVSLVEFSVIRSLELETLGTEWITHPQASSVIVGVAESAVHLLQWDLSEPQVYHFDYSDTALRTKHSVDQALTVDRVIVNQDKKHMLAQLSVLSQNSREKAFLYFEIPQRSTGAAIFDVRPIVPFVLPQDLSLQIAIALSFLSQNSFIFLSQSFSICSRRLPFPMNLSTISSAPASRTKSSATATATATSMKILDQRTHSNTEAPVGEKVKELFTLPGDWISRESLALCKIWGKERSLLCPRNGEVAVVRCTALH